MRTTDTGDDVLGFVGYIDRAAPAGDKLDVSVKGPAGLLEARPLPFTPPGIEHGTNPEAFEFHWRILDYVFGLPDPRTFPRFSEGIESPNAATVARFVATTRDLAASTILNSVSDSVRVVIDDDTDEDRVTATFSQRDSQAGFAVLLRHCHSDQEPARFGRVADILWQENERQPDGESDRRREILRQWRRAVGRLQQKSLDQLMRDKLARDEGMKILNFPEEHTPAFLLSAFNYGDLLHWDARRREVLAGWDRDDYEGPHARLSFLAAAAALVHVYIGFGVLAATATGTLVPECAG